MHTEFIVIGKLYNITKDTLDIETKNGSIEVYLSPELEMNCNDGTLMFEEFLGKPLGLRGYITPFGLFAEKVIPPKMVERFYKLYEKEDSSGNSIPS